MFGIEIITKLLFFVKSSAKFFEVLIMKKFLVFVLVLCFAIPFFGCYEIEEAESSLSEEESVSQASSEMPSRVVSEFKPEEKYTFLVSKYVVSTKKRFHDVTYSRKYYLVKGRVEGATLTTTLPDEKSAVEFYNETLKDYPDAIKGGTSVTVYMQGKQLGQYRSASLEKLLFLLETEGYQYSLNFDKDDYLDRYSGAVKD